MPLNVASFLLIGALVAAIVPPGYPAYIGSYAAIVISLLALLLFAWRERDMFRMPSAVAILGAITLISLSLPFVYRGSQDLLAPVLIMPTLSALGIAALGRPARWMPDPTVFASLALAAVALALVGGAYESYVLGNYRPGLGNNAIHFGSLAVMAGGMAAIGAVAGRSPWRYLFLLGPVFGLCVAIISGSRGPMLASAVMSITALPFLVRWFWRERLFRMTTIASIVLASLALLLLVSSGNQRALTAFDSAMNLFRFTGGPDDIRAALYTSAVHALARSPIYGHGLGQVMLAAQAMFPQQPYVHLLENLHADWANFAVMAGGLGLLAYLWLLLAPLLLLIDPIARQDRPIVLGACLLAAGQLSLGISNATFGILPQTVMYAVMLGYLMARARHLQQGAV